MKQRMQRILSLCLALVLLLGLTIPGSAVQVSTDLDQTARYLHTTVKSVLAVDVVWWDKEVNFFLFISILRHSWTTIFPLINLHCRVHE